MQIFSQKTGKMEALLLDDGRLTELRTAAMGALVAQILAPKNIQTIGILGTSVQSRYQLNMLPAVTDCKNVIVWGRTPSKVDVFVSEMSAKGWKVTAAKEPDVLLKECDLIVTTTCSRESVLGNSNLEQRKGQLIVCIGADAPGKYELNPVLIAKADLLVADIAAQSIERGEFQKAVADNLVGKETIVSLGRLLERDDLYRKEGDERLIIFDSSGVALQDCVVSSLVVDKIVY
jgi:ornithine cyclodeaminase